METPDQVFEEVTHFLLDGKTKDLKEDSSFAALPERPAGVEAARLRKIFLDYIAGHRKTADSAKRL